MMDKLKHYLLSIKGIFNKLKICNILGNRDGVTVLYLQ